MDGREREIGTLYIAADGLHLLSHSFTFSMYFILVRVAVDLELIPGTLSLRWEYTADGMPVHPKAADGI